MADDGLIKGKNKQASPDEINFPRPGSGIQLVFRLLKPKAIPQASRENYLPQGCLKKMKILYFVVLIGKMQFFQ